MHRLFTVENLVHEICSHASRSQLAVLARVSSTWFRCAVSHLYKDVSIWDALNPLAKKTENGTRVSNKCLELFHTASHSGSLQISAKSLTDEDFKRLSKYTPYVHTLNMNQYCIPILLEVMRNSVSKGISYIFPNLRHLDWNNPDDSPECRELAIGLLSPKVEGLSIYIEDDEDPILDHLCPLVMTRLSTLRFFSVKDDTAGEDSEYVETVQNLLTHFAQTLISVEITHSFNTPSMVECLSKLPNLCNLTIGQCPTKELKNEIYRDRSDSAAGFPSLRSVSFDEDPESFFDTFFKPYGLPFLTILCLEVSFTPDDVRILVSSIVATCPHIRSLTLGSEDDEMSTDDDSVVPWAFIELLSCRKELASLSVYGLYISVRPDELTEFLKSRKTWTRLHILTLDALRLQDMLLYAEHCPNIEHLGIHISTPDGFRVQDLPNDLPTFLNLTSIYFAGDTIKKSSSSRTIAQFLCRISKKPPHELGGIDSQVIHKILKSLANCYIEEERRTGTPMSSAVKEFVEERAKD